MNMHLVVGAGPVGTAVATELLQRGERVRVVTRSGSGPDGTERISADASDATRLTELAAGATAIYNCVNPPYHQWAQTWPAISDALIAASEASGAVLAVTGNLYGYGKVDAPMTEQTPLAATGIKGRVRNQMWADALAAHEAGRIRMFEVRAGSYLGGNSLLSMIMTPAWAKEKTALLPADLDSPHTFTDVRDVADLLVAGASDDRAWGRAWHVPSPAPLTMRTVAEMAAAQLGIAPKIRALPYSAVWVAGWFDPFVKELRETQHQFRAPFVLDSSLAQQTFGLSPRASADSVAYDLARNVPAPV